MHAGMCVIGYFVFVTPFVSHSTGSIGANNHTQTQHTNLVFSLRRLILELLPM